MSIQILMPALSPTMTQGNLVTWHKKEGDKVSAGEVLADIETDKATMEVESADAGILARILVPAGTDHVQVNQVIGILLEAGEGDVELAAALQAVAIIAAPAPAPSVMPRPPVQPPVQSPVQPNPSRIIEPLSSPTLSAPLSSAGGVRASPLARRLAAEKGIDLEGLQGSGPKGRIIARDVDMAARGGGVRSRPRRPDVTIPTSAMRQVIATRLVEAKQHIPHFYLNMDADMTAVMAVRAEINTQNPTSKVSLNDFVILAAAQALMEVPEANVSFQGATILQHGAADIAVAVSVEGGLFTPVIRGAESKTLAEISTEMRALVVRARTGGLKAAEFQGGSFTISNLGMYGISSFYAIVNPPAACILGVGAVEDRVVAREGAPVVRPMMSCTLSVDHRAVDGKVGADFLQALKRLLESPALLFYQASLSL